MCQIAVETGNNAEPRRVIVPSNAQRAYYMLTTEFKRFYQFLTLFLYTFRCIRSVSGQSTGNQGNPKYACFALPPNLAQKQSSSSEKYVRKAQGQTTFWSTFGLCARDVTAYCITDLVENTYYYLRILAVNAFG